MRGSSSSPSGWRRTTSAPSWGALFYATVIPLFIAILTLPVGSNASEGNKTKEVLFWGTRFIGGAAFIYAVVVGVLPVALILIGVIAGVSLQMRLKATRGWDVIAYVTISVVVMLGIVGGVLFFG